MKAIASAPQSDLRTALESATETTDPMIADLAAPRRREADPGSAGAIGTGDPAPPGAPGASAGDAVDDLEPQAGDRLASLLPEQVDALLEQYLGEPPRPRTPAGLLAARARAALRQARALLQRPSRPSPPILAAAALALVLAAAGVYALLAREHRGSAGAHERATAPPPGASTGPRAIPAPVAAAAPSPEPAPARGAAAIRTPAIAVPSARAAHRQPAAGAGPRADERVRTATIARPAPRAVLSAAAQTRESPRAEPSAAGAVPATPRVPPPAPPAPAEARHPGLSAGEVSAVIASYHEAFESCAADWLGSQPELSGATLDLLIAIAPTGAVAWAALADRTVESSGLGTCLVNAGRKMVFPPFRGRTFQVRIPLVLGQGGR